MTIEEWCTFRRLSRGMFYKMMKAGTAPKTYRAGVKRFISAEADREWQRQLEAMEAAE
jgi:predicted DNA-binding transcriptional regulator AlpA